MHMKYLKNSLILLIILICLNMYEVIDKRIHNYVIDNIYLNDNVSNKVDYLGYIEIERLGIKREIVTGINNHNLFHLNKK